jgi:hypothetical protein
MLELTAARPGRPSARDDGQPDGELDFDWRPQPLGRADDEDRALRWPIIFAALFVGVAVALVIRLFVASPAESAAARLDEYRSAATTLEEALRGALDGSTSGPATLSEAIDAARESLSQPLPRGVPIIGQGPGAELDAAHALLTSVTDSASEMVPRLEVSRTYREGAAPILGLPLLPTDAPADLVDTAARLLDEYRAGAVTAAAGLGNEPEFTAFREFVSQLVDGLPAWSDRYLLALRRGETATAAALVVELQARADLARAELNLRLDELETGIIADALGLIDALRQGGLIDAE